MERKMLTSLQGLKFICFIMIFGWHTYNFCNIFDSNYACRAVSFFMILSGFFMSLHYSEKIRKSTFKEHIIFVFRKIKKFYPLYLISLILLILRLDILQIKEEVRKITVSNQVLSYIGDLIDLPRKEQRFVLGASPRAMLALVRASQGCAFMRGRECTSTVWTDLAVSIPK